VKNTLCMTNCATELKIASSLPASARDAHGNLMEQHRPIGPARAIDTSKPGAAPGPGAAAPAATQVAAASVNPADIAKKNNCTTCHAPAAKLVGPSWADIAKKYKGDAKALAMLATKVKNGGQGVWGPIPMPANPNMKDNELAAVVQWVLDGAK